MKVDGEASEVSIVRGPKEFLQRTRPGMIIEANDVVLRQVKTSALELTEILQGRVTNFLGSEQPCNLSAPGCPRGAANHLLCRSNESQELCRGSSSPDSRLQLIDLPTERFGENGYDQDCRGYAS